MTSAAPIFHGSTKSDLLRWYDLLVTRSTTTSSSCTPIHWKSLIHWDILSSICRWDLEKDPHALTDTDIKEWVDRTLADVLDHMDQVMSELVLKPIPGQHLEAVDDLRRQYDERVAAHGWQTWFATPDGQRRAVQYLIEAVRPRGLQELIRSKVTCDVELAQDPVKFLGRLKQVADLFETVMHYNRVAHQKWEKKSVDDVTEGGEVIVKKKRRKCMVLDIDRGRNISCFNCHEKGHPSFLCPQNKDKKPKTQH